MLAKRRSPNAPNDDKKRRIERRKRGREIPTLRCSGGIPGERGGFTAPVSECGKGVRVGLVD